MKSIEITGKKRVQLGKSATYKLRNNGFIPCVLYDENAIVTHFFTQKKNFKNLIYSPNFNTVLLRLDDVKDINTILHEIQFHPVTDEILHADFYKINPLYPISVMVPICITGRAPGVIEGGLLQINTRKVKLNGLASKIPNKVIVNINNLKIGDKICVKDINDTKNYKFLHSDYEVIVAVKISRNLSKESENIENNKATS